MCCQSRLKSAVAAFDRSVIRRCLYRPGRPTGASSRDDDGVQLTAIGLEVDDSSATDGMESKSDDHMLSADVHHGAGGGRGADDAAVDVDGDANGAGAFSTAI